MMLRNIALWISLVMISSYVFHLAWTMRKPTRRSATSFGLLIQGGALWLVLVYIAAASAMNLPDALERVIRLTLWPMIGVACTMLPLLYWRTVMKANKRSDQINRQLDALERLQREGRYEHED